MYYSNSKHQNIKITNLRIILSSVMISLLCGVMQVNAQSAPEPPQTPPTPNSTSSSYSISVDHNDDKVTNSSVSISKTNDFYKFRARFHESLNENVKTLILKSLGKTNLDVKGNTYLWRTNENGNEVFECKLSKGQLRMSLDKELAYNELHEKIQALGLELKYFISGTSKDDEDAKTTARARRDLEKAERELEQAKRELARAEREAKQAGRN